MFCQVTMVVGPPGPKQPPFTFWFVLETAHKTMQEAHAELMRTGSICGTRYDVERDERGAYRIRGHYHFIAMRDYVVSVCGMRARLVTASGRVLADKADGRDALAVSA